jgi:hypothetical protein
MKRAFLLVILICFVESFSSQTDSLKKSKTSIGVQFGGQLVTEFAQNWFGYNYRYNSFTPVYTLGVYLKHKKHTFDLSFANDRFKPKESILFTGYNYIFNRTNSAYDLGFGGKLYYQHRKYQYVESKVKYTIYSNYALAYGATFAKVFNKTTFNLGLYNYFTVSGFNHRYEKGLPKLQILYGEEFSADMILEFKMQYRIGK